MTVQTDHLKINQNKHVLEYYSVLKHSCKFKWFWVDDKINTTRLKKKEKLPPALSLWKESFTFDQRFLNVQSARRFHVLLVSKLGCS